MCLTGFPPKYILTPIYTAFSLVSIIDFRDISKTHMYIHAEITYIHILKNHVFILPLITLFGAGGLGDCSAYENGRFTMLVYVDSGYASPNLCTFAKAFCS